jgi:hypothetical protein
MWALCSGYFNPDFVRMVNEKIKGAPLIDFWGAVERVA